MAQNSKHSRCAVVD